VALDAQPSQGRGWHRGMWSIPPRGCRRPPPPTASWLMRRPFGPPTVRSATGRSSRSPPRQERAGGGVAGAGPAGQPGCGCRPGAAAALSPKRPGRHPCLGTLYYRSLTVVAASAAWLAALRWLLLCLSPCERRRKRLSVVLGHVAEAAAGLGVDRPAPPAHLAPVGLQHPEDDPHGGGLPGAVRANEPEHLSFPDGERQVVEGDDVAVAAGQSLELEHLVSLPPAGRSPLPGVHRSWHLISGPRRRRRPRDGCCRRPRGGSPNLRGLESWDVHWSLSGRGE
jgi:hypothetical protein